jgi:DNA replicative helicase MCM subunit Mcm2 (Cdc46/Mcm family)
VTSLCIDISGKFVTIRGAVVRTGNVRPQCSHMTFRCTECDSHFVTEQLEGRFTVPTRCGTPDCGGKIFQTMESESTTKLVDARKIRLQDIQHCDVSIEPLLRCKLRL